VAVEKMNPSPLTNTTQIMINRPDIATNIGLFLGNSISLNQTSAILYNMSVQEKAARGLFEDSMKFDPIILCQYPRSLLCFSYSPYELAELATVVGQIEDPVAYFYKIIVDTDIMGLDFIIPILCSLVRTEKMMMMEDQSLLMGIKFLTRARCAWFIVDKELEMVGHHYMRCSDGFFIAECNKGGDMIAIGDVRGQRSLPHLICLLNATKHASRQTDMLQALKVERDANAFMEGVRLYVACMGKLRGDFAYHVNLSESQLLELEGYYDQSTIGDVWGDDY